MPHRGADRLRSGGFEALSVRPVAMDIRQRLLPLSILFGAKTAPDRRTMSSKTHPFPKRHIPLTIGVKLLRCFLPRVKLLRYVVCCVHVAFMLRQKPSCRKSPAVARGPLLRFRHKPDIFPTKPDIKTDIVCRKTAVFCAKTAISRRKTTHLEARGIFQRPKIDSRPGRK